MTQARTVHSRRAAIRKAIQNMIREGRSLTVRAVLDEAGGGSTTTARQEIDIAMSEAATRLVNGASALSGAERETALRERLYSANKRVEMLEMENSHLARALESASGPSRLMLDRFALFESDMRGVVEGSKEASQRILHEAKRLKSIETTVTREKPASDTLLEARFNKLTVDYAKLTQRYEKLRSQYFEKVGDFPD